MHKDLVDVIRTAREARDKVFGGTMSADDAHAIARNNHTINVAHKIALETRIFEARLRAALPVDAAADEQEMLPPARDAA